MSQNKSYVPPSLRNKAKNNTPSHDISSQKRTKKTEPSKEFSLTDSFPTLGETIKRNIKPTNTKNTNTKNTNTNTNNFLNAASKINTTTTTTTTTENDDPSKKDTSLPGWVYIRKNKTNNKIEYKYVEPTIHYIKDKLQQIEKENQQLGNVLFKYRIAREQYIRDIDVERLGDLSEFYGLPTLDEMYDNDQELIMNDNNDDTMLSYSDNE